EEDRAYELRRYLNRMESCLRISVRRDEQCIGVFQPILKGDLNADRGSFHEIRKNLPLLSIDYAQKDFRARCQQFASSIVEVQQNRCRVFLRLAKSFGLLGMFLWHWTQSKNCRSSVFPNTPFGSSCFRIVRNLSYESGYMASTSLRLSEKCF